MEKKLKGKAIYEPDGAAREYAKYACNFFIGCTGGCSYCFNRRWGWGNKPKLKSCFKDEPHALKVFEIELKENLSDLKKHGIFFSFATDPAIYKKTLHTTFNAIDLAVCFGVCSTILTKRADWVELFLDNPKFIIEKYAKYTAIGFTLTGHDELEPGASTNTERIEAMRKLYKAGFKTFVSAEPIVDFQSTKTVILQSVKHCNHYMIGIMSKKKYSSGEVNGFISDIFTIWDKYNPPATIYFKDTLLSCAGIKRENLPFYCVNKNYNIWSL